MEALKQDLEIPSTIKEFVNVGDLAFYAKLDEMSEQAFDDQCTGANPRYPLIQDLRELYIQAYENSLTEPHSYLQKDQDDELEPVLPTAENMAIPH